MSSSYVWTSCEHLFEIYILTEIEELIQHGTMLPQNMMGLTDEQVVELKLKDEWGDKCTPMGGWTFNKDVVGEWFEWDKKLYDFSFNF